MTILRSHYLSRTFQNRLTPRWSRVILSLVLGGAIAIGAGARASAAERVVLKYRWLQRSIPVADLSTLAESGEVSPELEGYLDAANQDPEALRRTLNRDIEMDPVLLDRALNNPIGNVVLDQVSPVIHTRSGRGDRQALRAALVLSASDDGRVSLIELIETYPTQEVYVEGDRLVQAYRDIARVQEQIERWTSRFGL